MPNLEQLELVFSDNSNDELRLLDLHAEQDIDYPAIMNQKQLERGQDLLLARRKLYLQNQLIKEIAKHKDINREIYDHLVDLFTSEKSSRSILYVFFPGNGFVSWKKLGRYYQKHIIKGLLVTVASNEKPLHQFLLSKIIFSEPFIYEILEKYTLKRPKKVKDCLSELQKITEIFYVKFKPLVIKLVNKRIYDLDRRSEAINYVYDVLVNAVHTYRPEYQVNFVLHAQSWILQAISRYVQSNEKHSGFQHIDIEEYRLQDNLDIVSSYEVDDLVSQERIINLLQSAIEKLDPTIRERLTRAWGIGVPKEKAKDIALELGITPQAVSSSVLRGVELLREHLADCKDEFF